MLNGIELFLHQNLIYWPSLTDALEQSLRAIWCATSQATVLILPQVKLNSQLSRCTSFSVNKGKSDLSPCIQTVLVVHMLLLSCIWHFVTSWTVTHQAPLFMELPRQEYRSGLPFSPPGNLPSPGTETASLASPELTGGFFTTAPPRKTHVSICLASLCAGHMNLQEQSKSESHSVVSGSLGLHGLYSSWNSPGQDTGVSSLSLPQWVFLTWESNRGSWIAGRFFTNWTIREALH